MHAATNEDKMVPLFRQWRARSAHPLAKPNELVPPHLLALYPFRTFDKQWQHNEGFVQPFAQSPS